MEVWHDGWMADEQGYHTEAGGTAYYRYFWAPEIHKVGGKWRIITYASLNRNSVWGDVYKRQSQKGTRESGHTTPPYSQRIP